MTLLRRYRIAAGHTQASLARKLKLSPSTVSLWESGQSIPHPAVIPDLAFILGITPIDLTRLIEPELRAPLAATG